MALRGKVAIITGSSSGIGAGIAVAFAKEGAKLSLTGRNQKNLEEVVKDCKKAGCQDVLINVGDITKDAFRRSLVEATKKKFGKIDTLVNNAGVFDMSPLQSATKEQYDRMMAVNVEAPLFLTQKRDQYVVLRNDHDYVKWRCLHHVEGGHRYIYKIPCSCPGFVPSNMTKAIPPKMAEAIRKGTPLGREGIPEEMGHIVAFLVSDKAAFITGESLRVDGGLTMTTPALG